MSPVRMPRKILRMRRRRPRLVRQESWRYVRLGEVWRKPKGIDNRMRLQKSGAPPLVRVGYRTPKQYRGLHPSGFREVLVHNLEELRKIDRETEAARIASSLSVRKRQEIYEAAKEWGIRVLNPPRPTSVVGGGT
ncbi:MAG: 50S ribosomal protein L32e [Nitrososphaerota archaeon]